MPRDRTTAGVHSQEATSRAREAAEQAKVTAAVAIVRSGKYYLGVSRRGKGNDFGFPGGGRETGETPEQCCLRELREETGIVGRIVRHVYTGPAGKKDICAAFEVSAADYSIRPAKGETGAVEWVVANIVCAGTFGAYNTSALKALASLSDEPVPVPAIPTCFNRMVDAYIERVAVTLPYGHLNNKYLATEWVEKSILEIPCRPVFRLIKPYPWLDWQVDETGIGGCGAGVDEPCKRVEHKFDEECNLASAIDAVRRGAYVSTRMLKFDKSCPSCGHDRDMHERPYGSSHNRCKHHGGCECHLAERYGVGEKQERRMSDEERRQFNRNRAAEERVNERWAEVARERRARFEPDGDCGLTVSPLRW